MSVSGVRTLVYSTASPPPRLCFSTPSVEGAYSGFIDQESRVEALCSWNRSDVTTHAAGCYAELPESGVLSVYVCVST